jgi:3-ketosteroid 9alpha-monooxygenase subunit A
MAEYAKGWYQLAFASEIANELSPVRVRRKRLILVRSDDHFRTFSGDCPHRGAHLASGGHLCGDTIICPFHGYKIGLAYATDDGFSIIEHPTLFVGGMIFGQLADSDEDVGWPQYIHELAEDHILIEGLRLLIAAPMETVIENAFDQRHFGAVHGVPTSAFATVPGPSGELAIESMFYVPLQAGTGRRDALHRHAIWRGCSAPASPPWNYTGITPTRSSPLQRQ